jgi:alkaline phosphatase D
LATSNIDKVDLMGPYARVIVVLLLGVMAGGCRSTGNQDATDLAIVGADTTVTRIAFGSCLRNPSGGPILDRVVAFDLDLFIWLGDNVYIDTNDDLDRFSQRYDALGRNPRFQALRETCPNLAIWDDHDYGNDNVGITYPLKEHSKQVFGRFWQVPEGEAYWDRPGIYRALEYGPEDRRVQVILLDGRWFLNQQDQAAPDAYLGAAQWAWLEQVLQRPAQVRLICSGVQVVKVNDQGPKWEMWGHYPAERQRLFDLIEQTRAQGVVFLSGDMHFAEIHRTTTTAYPLYDITASGLDQDHPHSGRSRDTGDFMQVGESYLKQNFGSIVIDWKRNAKIRLQIRDSNGEVRNEQEINLNRLAVPRHQRDLP